MTRTAMSGRDRLLSRFPGLRYTPLVVADEGVGIADTGIVITGENDEAVATSLLHLGFFELVPGMSFTRLAEIDNAARSDVFYTEAESRRVIRELVGEVERLRRLCQQAGARIQDLAGPLVQP